jgi:hypothetical protein
VIKAATLRVAAAHRATGLSLFEARPARMRMLSEESRPC